MLIVLRGLLTGISGGQTFFGLPESMLYLGTTAVARDAGLGLGVPARCSPSASSCSASPASAGRCTRSAATSTRPGRPASGPTGSCGSSLIIASVLAALAGLMLSGRLASVAAAQGNG